ncbi:hypothetical protein Poli38472_012393 [Pythium oligandrum]|uniref:Nudix hydrolase domain-containing protein n=1 Tax=Pythium oligandrum TaxID=41045 RepID=A0A8K1FPU9_PYTOL|nr:hypothetical protein Poli38472_012393 [Pythium oligandrum]|eukprot:TMW67277.1 hypothetical protein Poli38472_012393 [Pythium oligandrum]
MRGSRALPPSRLMSFSLASFVPTASAVDASGPFVRQRTALRLSSRFNRQSHPDPQVEAAIEHVWQEYKQKSPRLFNGTKFRLHHMSMAEDATLVLHCGLTDYRTYLGTCGSDIVTRLCEDSRRLAETTTASDDKQDAYAYAYLSRKIGVSAIVETADSRLVLIERSGSVGVYKQLVDTPGGHPEPSELSLTETDLDALESPDRDADRLRMENLARDRLFDSIVDEVHEEINVSSDLLSDPLLLGVVYQAEAHTPSFAFHMKTPLTANDVQKLYQEGPLDKFESARLHFLDAHAPSTSSGG